MKTVFFDYINFGFLRCLTVTRAWLTVTHGHRPFIDLWILISLFLFFIKKSFLFSRRRATIVTFYIIVFLLLLLRKIYAASSLSATIRYDTLFFLADFWSNPTITVSFKDLLNYYMFSDIINCSHIVSCVSVLLSPRKNV